MHRTNDGTVSNRNGSRSIAYVNADENGRNLNWNRLDNRWNRNNRFLAVRTFLLSSPGCGRVSVFFNLLSPPAEHLADFHENGGKHRILCCIQHFDFPRDEHKKLERIERCARLIDDSEFMGFVGVPGKQQELNQLRKECVNLYTKRVAR